MPAGYWFHTYHGCTLVKDYPYGIIFTRTLPAHKNSTAAARAALDLGVHYSFSRKPGDIVGICRSKKVPRIGDSITVRYRRRTVLFVRRVYFIGRYRGYTHIVWIKNKKGRM